LDHKEARRK
jgi:hypothetical protein